MTWMGFCDEAAVKTKRLLLRGIDAGIYRRDLDVEALRAVTGWAFTPTLLDGLPVAEVARLKSYDRGELIFAEGDPSDQFIIIVSGRVGEDEAASVCQLLPILGQHKHKHPDQR